MHGFINWSRYFAKLYFGVPTIETIGHRGNWSLCTLAIPYSYPGLLPTGINFSKPFTLLRHFFT